MAVVITLMGQTIITDIETAKILKGNLFKTMANELVTYNGGWTPIPWPQAPKGIPEAAAAEAAFLAKNKTPALKQGGDQRNSAKNITLNFHL